MALRVTSAWVPLLRTCAAVNCSVKPLAIEELAALTARRNLEIGGGQAFPAVGMVTIAASKNKAASARRSETHISRDPLENRKNVTFV